jgi:hypothetical protein
VFKVSNGLVEAVASPFSDREDGLAFEDDALRLPEDELRQQEKPPGHVPLDRAFPTGGFM